MKARALLMAALLSMALTACSANSEAGRNQPDGSYSAGRNGRVSDGMARRGTGSALDDAVDMVEDAGDAVGDGAKDIIDGAEDVVDDVGQGVRRMTDDATGTDDDRGAHRRFPEDGAARRGAENRSERTDPERKTARSDGTDEKTVRPNR